LTNGHIREEDLELYALGALPDDEAAAIKAHVSGCSECASTLSEARGRAALLALSVPQENPRPAVKERLFARIAAERAAGLPSAAKEERKPSVPWWRWVFVPTSIALAVACLLLSWQNRKLGDELNAARLATKGIEREKQHVEDLARVLASPDTITVKLAGTSDAPQAAGFVKYNPQIGMVLYAAQHLPPLPAEKTYQMWLVPASGAPISAGVFKPEDSASRLLTAQVRPDTKPQAFAVTIEPAGGVPQPTGPKVLLGAT
jgi:anti-sigma-K factor RskA